MQLSAFIRSKAEQTESAAISQERRAQIRAVEAAEREFRKDMGKVHIAHLALKNAFDEALEAEIIYRVAREAYIKHPGTGPDRKTYLEARQLWLQALDWLDQAGAQLRHALRDERDQEEKKS